MKFNIITDLHFGNGNDCQQQNQDTIDFFDWIIEKSDGTETLVIMGDTFHSRNKLSIDTINYALQGIKTLSNHYERIIILIGNHDMHYRDTRKVNSCEIFRHIPNVEIIDDYLIEGDSIYVSWLCNEEEYDNLIKITKEQKLKYMFSHMEFSSFLMNDFYEMIHGQSHKELKHMDIVFTGHYHGRQIRDNIVYIGTPLPRDFNDSNDPNKGMCIFDNELGTYEFVNYEKVHVLTLTPDEILNTNWDDFDLNDVIVRVVVEDDVSRETLESITDILDANNFRTNKLVYKPKTDNKVIAEVTDLDHLMSIDEAVITHIKGMSDNESFNKDLLIELYQEIVNV